VLIVLCPTCSGTGVEDRWFRKKMSVVGMSIGLEGFGLGIDYVKAHWLVQRWVAGQAQGAIGEIKSQ